MAEPKVSLERFGQGDCADAVAGLPDLPAGLLGGLVCQKIHISSFWLARQLREYCKRTSDVGIKVKVSAQRYEQGQKDFEVSWLPDVIGGRD